MNNEGRKQLRTAGIFIGIGMGGFLDGIFFHQIFQIHNMLSNLYFPDTIVNLEINMAWDGFFHLFTWIMVAIGIALLWKVIRLRDSSWSIKFFLGSIALGWGLFNFIEGIIDHHILEVHHVMQRATAQEQMKWDLLFDASGIILSLLGFFLMRQTSAPETMSPLEA